MENEIRTVSSKPMMSTREIADLTGSNHSDVKRSAERLSAAGILTQPLAEFPFEHRGNTYTEYRFNKRDSLVLVARLSPEFTAAVVDRWQKLEDAASQQPKTQNEIIAAMAIANVEQERRINNVEDKVEQVAETIEQIKRGSVPAGWAAYSLIRVKCGMTDTKCRTLARVYGVPTDSITILTPDGQPRPMKIVLEADFMATFRGMMSEAVQRGTKWYHPNMGLFQVIGWEAQ